MMLTETEAKLKVDSLEAVTKKLSELGAEFVDRLIQRDSYFDDKKRTMTISDKCLRIRTELTASEQKTYLTYKGPREKAKFKTREEINIEIEDFDAIGRLLSVLGYEQVLAVEKTRLLYRYDGCELCLDELPLLGTFVEIEGPDESSITEVQKKLGLENLPHTPESYAALIAEKLHNKAKEQKSTGE